MTLFPPEAPVPSDARGASIALGNFDGVHRGHRAVLDFARSAAQARGLALGAAVFEPHPRRFFHPDAPPFRLQSRAQRARALGEAGAVHVYEIGFDEALSQLSDAAFAEQVLVRRLGAAHVSVGAHFRFGRGRMGDVASLKALGAKHGFEVAALPELTDPAGVKISSTAIRAVVAQGEIEVATHMLGRAWAVEGVVERGFQRGRGLGFATANVRLGDYQRPKLGVYAIRAHLGDGNWRPGVASIGVNPTFTDVPEPLLEAHLFDFDADLYGRMIEVQLIACLRAEAKFDTTEALAAQIAADAAQARAILSA